MTPIRRFSLLLALGALGAQAQSTRWGGYVQPLASWGKGGTFFEGEGALMLRHEDERGHSGLLDLPVRLARAGASSALVVGRETAQAYLVFPAGRNLAVRLGQFDKIVGMEANDATDRATLAEGLLHVWMPKSHVGALLMHDFSELIGVNVLLANPGDRGLRMGAPRPSFDFGLQALSRLDTHQVKASFLHSNSGAGLTRTYLEIQGLSHLGSSTLGVDAVFNRSSSFDPGFGVSALYARQVAETWSLALRFEWLKKSVEDFPPDGLPPARVTQRLISFGGSWDANRRAKIRFEYVARDEGASGWAQEVRTGLLQAF